MVEVVDDVIVSSSVVGVAPVVELASDDVDEALPQAAPVSDARARTTSADLKCIVCESNGNILRS